MVNGHFPIPDMSLKVFDRAAKNQSNAFSGLYPLYSNGVLVT